MSGVPEPVLQVRDLVVDFRGEPHDVRAVDGLDLALAGGRITGLVGESGSGKSAAALAMLGLLPPAARVTRGQVLWRDRDLLDMAVAELDRVRGGEVALVFQEPLSALNPVIQAGAQVAEVARRHRGISRKEAWDEAVALLERFGVTPAAERARAFPHQLSGGLRQRVMLAVALAGDPAFIIADEPTTALDPTLQAQVVQELVRLSQEDGLGVLLITHDIGLAASCCHDLAVMRAGQIVEAGAAADLVRSPGEAYTRELVALAQGEAAP